VTDSTPVTTDSTVVAVVEDSTDTVTNTVEERVEDTPLTPTPAASSDKTESNHNENEDEAKNAVSIVQLAIEQQARHTQQLLLNFDGEWKLDVARTLEHARLPDSQTQTLQQLRRELKLRVTANELIYVRDDIETRYPYNLESGESNAVILSTQHNNKPVTLTLTVINEHGLNLKTAISPDLNNYVWHKDDGSQEEAPAPSLPAVFLGRWQVDVERTATYFKANSPKGAEVEQMRPVFEQLMTALKLQFSPTDLIYHRGDKENAYPYTLLESSATHAKLNTLQGGKQMEINIQLVDDMYLNFRVSGSDDLSYYLWRKE
jgi:hypothetical protein